MTFEELVASLEGARLDDEEVSVEELEAWVVARQPLIDQLTRLDPLTLSPEQRLHLAQVVQRLYDDDRRVIERAQAAREHAEDALADIANARTAARGYRDAAPHRAGAVLRTA